MLREEYEKALQRKANDIRNFIWKGPRIKTKDGKIEQTSKRMVDCSVDELKSYHKYCEEMLYNPDKNSPGRTLVLDIVRDQRQRCNVELFLRWLQKAHRITKYSFMNSIYNVLQANPDVPKESLTVSSIVGGCPREFENLPIPLVLDGCMDKLGLFNRKHLTNMFLFKQGICPSEKERKEANTKITPNYVIEYLELNPQVHYRVRLNDKGLTLEQMKSLLSIKYKKYADMSQTQLELLRNRILWQLENEIMFHIKQWNTRKEQLEKVLAAKGVTM